MSCMAATLWGSPASELVHAVLAYEYGVSKSAGRQNQTVL